MVMTRCNPLPSLVLEAQIRSRRALEGALGLDALPAADELRLSRLYVGLSELQQRLLAAERALRQSPSPSRERHLHDLQARTWVAAALLDTMVAVHSIDPRTTDAPEREADLERQAASLTHAFGKRLFA